MRAPTSSRLDSTSSATPHAGGDGGTFRRALFEQGVLVATGVAGVYGRGRDFEDTVERLDASIVRAGRSDNPTVLRFPPVLNRAHFERTGYLESFPHLAGTVHAFTGSERAHREMTQAVESGRDWGEVFAPTPMVLTPAACLPIYPSLTGTLPTQGRLFDVMSYCFRHEPSDDPVRMQTFRMHEHVYASEAAAVIAWRQGWLPRVESLMSSLGLQTERQVATDPFFGRGATLLAASQRERQLKIEIVATVVNDAEPTAIASLNYHEDHFGRTFAIWTASGDVAHSACVAFGIERMTLALYRQHGFDRGRWPAPVRQELGL